MSITRRPAGSSLGEHLGDRVSALVDAALDPREHERLLAHVAVCSACRLAVDGERAAKAWVSRLSQPEIGVALTATLLTLPGGTTGTTTGRTTRPGFAPPAVTPAATAMDTDPVGQRRGLPLALPAARSGRSSVRTFAALSGAGATAAAVLFVGAAAAPATGVVASSGVTPLTTPASTAAAAPALTLTQAAATLTEPAATMPKPPAMPGAPTPLVATAAGSTTAVLKTGVLTTAVSAPVRPAVFAVRSSVSSTPWLHPAVGAVAPGVAR